MFWQYVCVAKTCLKFSTGRQTDRQTDRQPASAARALSAITIHDTLTLTLTLTFFYYEAPTPFLRRNATTHIFDLAPMCFTKGMLGCHIVASKVIVPEPLTRRHFVDVVASFGGLLIFGLMLPPIFSIWLRCALPRVCWVAILSLQRSSSQSP